jgi:hypothetical protein
VAVSVVLSTAGVAVVAAVPADAGDDPHATAVGPTTETRHDDDTEAFLECTNGTSDAVLACGYTPGPNAVEIDSQTVSGDAVEVRAAELSAGGFVAVHRIGYVDGAFTESLVGTSEYLSSGLHRGIDVELDEELDSNVTLVAVVNRDSDDDRQYDFVATEGTDDRPYTNTYSERAGNVTDEAGDVIGDYAPVTVLSVEYYAGADGEVDRAELQEAVNDFVTGELDMELFQDVVRAWTSD